MNINQATLDLVKRFEGLELTAYLDPVGVLTIGYGYTNRAGFGPGVSVGETWTKPFAEQMLWEGLERFADQIRPMFRRTPNDNEFGAMLSLAYNIGVGAFSRSTCLRRFNAGDIDGAAEALTWFNKAGGKVLRGLTRRRAAERELFLTDAAILEATPKADAERSSPAQSSTIRAVAGTAAAGAGGVLTALGKLDPLAQYILLGFSAVALIGLGWIARERLRKWAGGAR